MLSVHSSILQGMNKRQLHIYRLVLEVLIRSALEERKSREEAGFARVLSFEPVPTDPLTNAAKSFKERMARQRFLELGQES